MRIDTKWANRFMRRVPGAKLVRGHIVDLARFRASTQANVRPWLERLAMLRAEHGYALRSIWNIDETNTEMEGRRRGKVLIDKGKKQALILGASRWPTTTLTMCVSAAGRAAVTRVLLGGAKVPPAFEELDPKYFEVKTQASGGWQTSDSFVAYMRERCIPEILAARLPRDGPNARSLLILDSHPSRRNPQLWRECAENRIDVPTIPAHCSHLLQPLDRGVNAAYKRKLAE
jgi:hypothetical protein